MPSSALAIASSRRATRASDFLLASLRSTTGDRSLRIHSAVILPSSNQSEGNHEPDPLGIAPRQQESSLSTPGIIQRGRGDLPVSGLHGRPPKIALWPGGFDFLCAFHYREPCNEGFLNT